ncbi:ArsR/SmtB family transcription factor [Aquabacter sp. P-9]|uniref:ArsR/SmtB family transcription factor n=1 Tax=Aquabacter sediminis TaxID=3029197 RepID=UPI00237E4734|nr:helix-turn-helix domain-containing protein [Aquabacter sp. P-9]MDE1569413.1 helix-turn-helix domain-containing protein [Aquabacter sp. P-9]
MAGDGSAQTNDVFQALAHPVRRALMDLLRDGDRAEAELGRALDLGSAELTEQVAHLAQAGLVERKGDAPGTWRLSLAPAALGPVDAWLTPYRPFKLVRMADFRRLVEGELRNGR